MTYKKNFKTVISYLPFSLKTALNSAENLPDNIMEIHLICGKPLMLHTAASTFFISEENNVTDIYSNRLIKVTNFDIENTFINICGYSVYSKQSEISNGFITLSGGNRAGICGTAVINNNGFYNIRDISSINIRIANEIRDCSNILFKNYIFSKGMLICGEPCSGKTTILRDIARKLSYTKKVSIIDTRYELAACINRERGFDTGLADVFSGYSKTDGFEQSVRCMSPEIIVCDEINSEDINAVINAQKSGVSVIASAHCKNRTELISDNFLNKLVKSNCFDIYVFLKDRENIGQVSEIIRGDNLC